MSVRPLLATLLALVLAACAAGTAQTAHHPEARAYDAGLDASTAVDAALVRAAERDTLVLLVLGANWCHDSRALAGWLETPRFRALVEQNYELVFVNVGRPQSDDGHNLHIARRFGIDELPGTPNLFVVTPGGALLNAASVTDWRNAASRSEDAIYDELARFAAQK